MTKELIEKIIRFSVVGVMFLALFVIQGISDDREANLIVFMLAMISLFSLIIGNIWVTLFILLTVFLFSFFKFQGGIYLSNIFFGSVLYYITKISFKREHTGLFIEGFLWFVLANLVYMVIQVSGLDFIFSKIHVIDGFEMLEPNLKPTGFMGHLSITAALLAMSIPVLASRGSKWSWAGALLLFFPLYLCKTSLCFVMGLAGLLFILYFKIPKRIWTALIVVMLLCGLFYIQKVDKPGFERLTQWKRVMKDYMIHPITGWGLDSFRNFTPQKDFVYQSTLTDYSVGIDSNGRIFKNVKFITYWDNPHNLIISLLSEWGFFGLFFFICYNIQNIKLFIKAIKYPDVIGLAGFLFVFLGVSMGHFPIFLARLAVCIIPAAALFEIAIRK